MIYNTEIEDILDINPDYCFTFSDDKEYVYDMNMSKTKSRFKKMCNRLNEKTSNILIKQGLKYIVDFPGDIEKIHLTREYKDILSKLNINN